MASHIPFINSENDCSLLKRYYKDSPIVRVSLASSVDKIVAGLPKGMLIWLDPGVDVYDEWPPARNDLENKFRSFDEGGLLTGSRFPDKPDRKRVQILVNKILDVCASYNPFWLSVPQLPMISGTQRNRLNKLLAEATYEWKKSSGFRNKLILPVVLTHQDQTKFSKHRTNTSRLVEKCYERSNADGLWVVDSSLDDQRGSDEFGRKRFPNLISLHEDLNRVLPSNAITVAGPYWGMNLILWARGLVKYPAIGLGRGFQYRIPGGKVLPSKRRIAIASLRRQAVVASGLKFWLEAVISSISDDRALSQELSGLLRKLDTYLHKSASLDQVASFYKEWFDKLESVPPAGRALALFQDLSNAFVVGKRIEKVLPETPRRPEKVAQQFMLSCL